ncbi:MAG: hypothetical protein IJZ16_10195 [Clostridia bacterium]|nr:hypothetical protein [Clostridia bacterium]
MDNYFYDNKRKQSKEKPQSPMTKVIVVQLVVSLLVSGVLFMVCKGETEFSDEVKALYNEKCQTDIAASTVIDVLKGVVKETFSPSIVE